MSTYRHKKSGRLYTAAALVINCTNDQDGQKMVLYQAAHQTLTPKLFAREITEFLEKFEPVVDDSGHDSVHLWAEG